MGGELPYRQRFEFPALVSYRRSGSPTCGGVLGGVAVFVDQAAEAVDSFDLLDAAASGGPAVSRSEERPAGNPQLSEAP